MSRLTFTLGALIFLGACSSHGTSPVFTAIKEVVLPSKSEEPIRPKTVVTREMIEKNGLAMVRANIEGDDVANILSATSLNGEYVTYVSGFRQSVTLLGSLVTATRGLGGDLLSVRSDADDPVAHLTTLKNWKSRLTRDYRFPGIGPDGSLVSVSCALTKGGSSKLTIVELTYDVTEITENCSGDGVTFTNTYFADNKTGQIWKTRQWIGEKVGFLNFEVLEPFTLD